MLHGQKTVTVYSFQLLADALEQPRHAAFKAPREEIASRYHGAIVLEGTAQVVPESELDEERRYRRRATGWGDL